MFTDMGFDCTLQLTFKKLLIVEFWSSAKEEQPQLSRKYFKMVLLLPTIYLYEIWVFLFPYTSTKTTYHNRFSAKAGMGIHLPSTKPDNKEICKKV